MNNCGYFAMKYQYNFVDDLPQVMRRMPFNHLTAAFLRSFSEKQSLFSDGFQQHFPHLIRTVSQRKLLTFSAFTHALLLSLLFIYKKG